MSEQRKNEVLQQFRRPGNKSSRSKDLKNRLHQMRSKETFLTDTQASDYTKSSGEINSPRNEYLQETVRKLQKENSELKQRICGLKANQFFELNEEKIKTIIKQSQRLKQENQKIKKELDHSLVERDFLERFNKNLKIQCETLTREMLLLKSNGNSVDPKRNQRSIYLSRDDGESNRSKNSCQDLQLSKRSKESALLKNQKEENHHVPDKKSLLKTSLSASRLHEDYYSTRVSKNRPHKNN